MLKKLRHMRNDEKGFTLVELIVVLVILAILAALLIPALTGYIDKAKEKQVVAETRQVVMAAQTLADEKYAAGVSSINFAVAADENEPGSRDDAKIYGYDVRKLSEVPKATNITDIVFNGEGKVTKVVYASGGKTCTYNGTEYTVTVTP